MIYRAGPKDYRPHPAQPYVCKYCSKIRPFEYHKIRCPVALCPDQHQDDGRPA